MSPLSALAPDQRAVLELLLRQGRDYAELSELLGLPESGVRSRAHAALAALAPDRPAPVGEDGAVADWILGQQDDEEAERTSGAIARMPAWHAWASAVTDRLSEVEGAELPELPQPEADEPAPTAKPTQAAQKGRGRARPVRDGAAAAGAQHARRRADAAAAAGKNRGGATAKRARPLRERPAPAPPPDAAGGGEPPLRSSRRGGLVLLAGVAVAVAVVLFFVFRGGDDNAQNASSDATPTPTASPQAQVVNEIALKGNGNKARGLMQVYKRDQGGLVFALAADRLPPNKQREVYAVWFTKKGGTPRNLGFAQTQVGDDNVFTTGGPQQGQETDFAKWLVDYDRIVVARASADNAKASKPGRIVLSGTLPGGQD
jgi:Sigma-70, region 4